MVQIRSLPHTGAMTEADFAAWFSALPQGAESRDIDRLVGAAALLRELSSEQGVATSDWVGRSAPVAVGLEVAQILAELGLGTDALVAGMLYRSVREQRLEMTDLKRRTGPKVASLVEGALRMAAVSELTDIRDEPVLGQAAAPNVNVRRMLVAMVDDVRIALIKLAERTVAMRGLKKASNTQRQRIAGEVFSVYAPLAHRLGIGHLKWELEDLSFRYTHEEPYHRIAKLLDGRRADRDRFIDRVKADLTKVLAGASIDFELAGRAKHIYSIWRKMQRKGIGFSQVHDIRALRILVQDVADCYQTLGIVHGMWRNIPNEFDDYIANPKENGYRSLHTAVIGPEGKILEIQIRTRRMHEEAELGVCAHWRYKGSDKQDSSGDIYEAKLTWLRQVLEWHEAGGDDAELAEQFSFESAQDRVYVFTPKGDVVSLIYGATPLDFAYHVHTEVGHRCRGAKVNGVLVPLTTILETGQRVEILTASEQAPRRDWLRQSAGYLKTTRAKARVQQWFRSLTRDENIAAGRAMVERECARLSLTSLDYKEIAKQLGLKAVEEMFMGVGSGELSAKQILRVAQTVTRGDQNEKPFWVVRPSKPARQDAVRVDGVGNMLTQFARCCMPVPGDPIEGYITKSRGITVHRSDCARLLTLSGDNSQRIISVSWGAGEADRFPVKIGLTAYDRQGLLADVSSVMARERVNVTAINTLSNPAENTADMKVTAEVSSIDALLSVLEKLSQLDNVIAVKRLVE
jgi:GTP pyrophosphokinase